MSPCECPGCAWGQQNQQQGCPIGWCPRVMEAHGGGNNSNSSGGSSVRKSAGNGIWCDPKCPLNPSQTAGCTLSTALCSLLTSPTYKTHTRHKRHTAHTRTCAPLLPVHSRRLCRCSRLSSEGSHTTTTSAPSEPSAGSPETGRRGRGCMGGVGSVGVMGVCVGSEGRSERARQPLCLFVPCAWKEHSRGAESTPAATLLCCISCVCVAVLLLR